LITQKLLGQGGRLANQLFGIAALIGIAKRNHTSYCIPDFAYKEYFENDFTIDVIDTHADIREPHFHYSDVDLPDGANFNLKGYYQSVKYFENAEDEVCKALTFKQAFKERVRKGYDFSKPVIAIHIRRGDYVQHNCYYQLPITYFYRALTQWPDWRECNIIIFSDDIPYCKLHFECLENVQFAIGSDIEDMCLMSQCDRFVLSNSSYSWWAVYLSGSKEVIRPDALFDNDYALSHNDKDFWIPDWQPLAPEQKLDLTDVTFTIPAFWDHPDRSANMKLTIFMLQYYFNTNIMLMENMHRKFEGLPVDYRWCDYPNFHRTRMLNDMARLSTTRIVFNWDADIIISPVQIVEAVERLRSGADMVLPYDGRFARMPPDKWYAKIRSFKDIGIVANIPFKGLEIKAKTSYGGAIGFIKDRYMAIGGENENFISFGAEDTERICRAEKLGLKIERVKGILFHVDHWMGVNSSTRNPYFFANKAEFEKVKGMGKEELIEYVKSWNENKES
jgi:hypothetical protein